MTDRDITLREFVEHGIEHMEVLRVEPGDVCVLRCSHELSLDAVDRLNRGWEHAFRGAVVPRLIVLDGNLALGVLRPDPLGPEESTKGMPPGSTSPEPGRLSPIPAVGASDEGAGESCLGPLTRRKGVALEQADAAPTFEAER